MPDSHQYIPRELEAIATDGDRVGERAPNILLQIVLPLVMILAILANEVPTLQKQLDELVRDVAGTPTDRLRSELNTAVLSLQHQLLLRATDQAAAEERKALRLESYADALPSPSNLANGVVSDSFRQTTTTLAGRFNGRGREYTRKRLARLVEVRFRQLAKDYLGGFGPRRQERLLAVEAHNRELFKIKLDGHLSQMELEAAKTQSRLIISWLTAPPSDRVKQESAELWIRIAEGAARRDDLLRAFDDLKVIDLFETLRKMDISMLDEVERAVL